MYIYNFYDKKVSNDLFVSVNIYLSISPDGILVITLLQFDLTRFCFKRMKFRYIGTSVGKIVSI